MTFDKEYHDEEERQQERDFQRYTPEEEQDGEDEEE